jgi:hypothetical protein
MSRSKLLAAFLILSMLAAGCSATTNLQAVQRDTQLRVKTSSETAVPRADKFSSTTFGNYEFEAKLDGHPPICGILPLKFNGGYLPAEYIAVRSGYFLQSEGSVSLLSVRGC